MPAEFRADDIAIPVDDVEYTLRQTRFMQTLRQDLRLDRAHLAWLDDDGRTGGDGGCELRGHETDITVPGGDGRGDARRLSPSVDRLSRWSRRPSRGARG